ncbi:hypothetical protein [Compostimonas suwonensis]|uniref:Uncharacterized protein n=1 Tax=Compostimonas suwonensis TaxID=1048394 RepID=A0A2M9BC98_9MICO|nr:hypothetical protein [Compostimonas suwonensis]PJJ55569.1 hypothetical protein CLV54_2916 [Compostimonas suwonensis]
MDAVVIIAIVVAVWLTLAVFVALLFGRVIRRRNLEERRPAPVEPSEQATATGHDASQSFTSEDVAALSRVLGNKAR